MGTKSDCAGNRNMVKKAENHWSGGLLKAMKDPKLIVSEDELTITIRDLYPKAKFHYLVCPKEDISSIKMVEVQHLDLLKYMHSVAEKLSSRHKDSNFLIGYHSVPSMIRDCKFYKLEYKECKSFKGRFYQYFLYGDFLDCSEWQEDFKNCEKSLGNEMNEREALESIIRHENKRLEKRMKAHVDNDVWEKRDKPPEDWNEELPDWLKKRNANAFSMEDDKNKRCIIF